MKAILNNNTDSELELPLIYARLINFIGEVEILKLKIVNEQENINAITLFLNTHFINSITIFNDDNEQIYYTEYFKYPTSFIEDQNQFILNLQNFEIPSQQNIPVYEIDNFDY